MKIKLIFLLAFLASPIYLNAFSNAGEPHTNYSSKSSNNADYCNVDYCETDYCNANYSDESYRNGRNEQDSVLSRKIVRDTMFVPYVYKVNKYKLLKPHLTVDSLCLLINSIAKNKFTDLLHIDIAGSASPEGPWRWNFFLGETRGKALEKYILENTPVSASKISRENLIEEWQGTIDSLRTHPTFPYADSIISIIETHPESHIRKQMIRKLEYGRIWHRLIHEIFPPLRNARIVLSYYEISNIPMISYVPPKVDVELMKPYGEPIFKKYPPVPQETRFFALKTNALFLAALCANIGFEVELWPKWSLDFPFWYSPYDLGKPYRKIRLFGIQPELRRWFGDKAGEGFYAGIHGHVFGFNIAINDHARYQDPNHALYGGGLGCGFAFDFGKDKQWYVDAGIGMGYANYVYDKYRNWHNGPDVSPRFVSRREKNYWGITRMNISVGYKWYKPRKRRNRR